LTAIACFHSTVGGSIGVMCQRHRLQRDKLLTGSFGSEASCKYELVDAGFYKVGGPRHDFNLEAFLVHSTRRKGLFGAGTRLVTHDLRTYYTLYLLCTTTSVHYQGAAAKADAIGEHWIESGAVDIIRDQQLKHMQLGKQQLKQMKRRAVLK